MVSSLLLEDRLCGVNLPQEDLSMIVFLPAHLSLWRTSLWFLSFPLGGPLYGPRASPWRTSLWFSPLPLEDLLSMVTGSGEGEEVTSRGPSGRLEDH